MEVERRYKKRKSKFEVYPKVGVGIYSYEVESGGKLISPGMYKKIVFQTLLRKKSEEGVWYKIKLRGTYYLEIEKFSPEAIIEKTNEFHAEVYQVIIRGRIRMSDVPPQNTTHPGALVFYAKDPTVLPIFEMLGDKERLYSKTETILVIDTFNANLEFPAGPDGEVRYPFRCNATLSLSVQSDEIDRLHDIKELKMSSEDRHSKGWY